jgi:hypothetical protein
MNQHLQTIFKLLFSKAKHLFTWRKTFFTKSVKHIERKINRFRIQIWKNIETKS